MCTRATAGPSRRRRQPTHCLQRTHTVCLSPLNALGLHPAFLLVLLTVELRLSAPQDRAAIESITQRRLWYKGQTRQWNETLLEMRNIS